MLKQPTQSSMHTHKLHQPPLPKPQVAHTPDHSQATLDIHQQHAIPDEQSQLNPSITEQRSMATHHHHSHSSGADHTGHELLCRQRFWFSLALSLPVLLFSPMLQMWFGFTLPTGQNLPLKPSYP